MLKSRDSRKKFLQLFLDNGEGRGKDALKFVYTFTGDLIDTDKTTVGHKEDYFTSGEILAMWGKNFRDYESTAKAMEDVEYLVEKNRKESMWKEEDHPPLRDEVKPEFSKFWYEQSLGKENTWTHEERKHLQGEAVAKDIKQIESGMQFMEAFGFPEGGESQTTIEYVAHGKLMTVTEELKLTYT